MRSDSIVGLITAPTAGQMSNSKVQMPNFGVPVINDCAKRVHHLALGFCHLEFLISFLEICDFPGIVSASLRGISLQVE
jgi:hypothetical protein